MEYNQNELLKKIEKLRLTLSTAVQDNGLNHPLTIKISQELDTLLNTLNNNNKKN